MSSLRATSAGSLQDAAWPCQPRAGLAIRSIIECKVDVSIWLCLPRLVGTHGLQSPSDLQDYVGGKSGMSFLPNRDLVFVVDDDASMLKSVARLLRQLGYGSLLFPSAEAFANHTDFDRAVCVLLDINLGDVSGIELRHRLKAAGNHVPVIYITGNESPAIREAALASGCIAFLTKTFSMQSLIEPLKKASAGRS